MAATDITYAGLDPVSYTPDFSFLRYVLDKKEGQYEQGLKQASASYNALKKELTDPTNVNKREDFFKNIKGQLETIASSDLSLQQNVNYANSVFDPLANDKAFIYDSYYTARNKKELAKMDQWANSSDPEERKKFNPEIQAWLKRDLDSIKNGKGDIANYKVEGRSAFAYINPQDLLDKAVKDKGFEYKVDDLGNPYIVTTEGGQGGVENYTTFAENVLASDPLYQQQLNILAKNRQEQILDLYKKDPNLSLKFADAKPEEIYADYAKISYNEHKSDKKDYLEKINKGLEKDLADNNAFINANADKLAKGANDLQNGVNSEEAKLFNQQLEKTKKINDLKQKSKFVQQEYDDMYGGTGDEKLNNYVTQFSKNPTAFFSNQQLNNDVTRFSNIKSSSLKRTIKEDRAVVDVMVAKTNAMKTINDIKDDIIDNATDQQKIALKEAELALKGMKLEKGKDGTTTTTTKEADIVNVDIEGTQITLVNNLNKIKEAIATASNRGLGNIIEGMSILESMGMSSEEVGKLRSYFRKYYTASDSGIPFTETTEDNKIVGKAYNQLFSFSRNNNLNKFLEPERKGRKSLHIKDLPELLTNAVTGYESSSKDEMAAKTNILEYNSDMQALSLATTALQTGKNAVIEAKKNDPVFAGIFVKRADGKTDLINEEDIANQVATYYARFTNYDQSGRPTGPITFSKEKLKEIAQHYMDGTFDINKDNVSNSVFKVSPEKYQQLIKRINSEVSVPGFEDMVGKVVGSPFYKLNGEVKQQVINTLGHITPTNSQIFEYPEGTSEFSNPDDATQQLVRDALPSKDAISEVTLMTASPTNNGGQAVQIKFAVDLKKGDGSKNPLAGRSFFFPVTPTEASAPIFKVFERVNEVSEFDPKRKKGETYNLDTFKAEGVRAEIIPSEPGSNTGKVILYQKKYDPNTKTYSDDFEKIESSDGSTYMTYDLTKTTFSDLKNIIYQSFVYPYVTNKLAYKKQSAATSNSTYTSSSIQSYLQGLIK